LRPVHPPRRHRLAARMDTSVHKQDTDTPAEGLKCRNAPLRRKWNDLGREFNPPRRSENGLRRAKSRLRQSFNPLRRLENGLRCPVNRLRRTEIPLRRVQNGLRRQINRLRQPQRLGLAPQPAQLEFRRQEWVAQAIRLCRPATGRTERGGRSLGKLPVEKVRTPSSFRAAGRRSAQAGRLCYPGGSFACTVFYWDDLCSKTSHGEHTPSRAPAGASPFCLSVQR